MMQFYGFFASALSSSDAQQVRAIIRQELTNMFNPGHSISGEITDESNDWINLATNQIAIKKGSSAPNYMSITDISAVDYFNDGKFLNATLWTNLPFKDKPTRYEQVNYGMLIDSDFNSKTGYRGIDFLLQIGWNNDTKTWFKTLTEWSTTGERIVLENNTLYLVPHQGHTLVLSLDLNSITHHDKYKVAFYAETKKSRDSSFITDFTRWVTFPPLSVDISTFPPILTLRPGDSKTIAVRVNSTTGYEPEVILSTYGQTGIRTSVEFNKLRIPSYGTAPIIPLTVSATTDALVGPHRLIIFANSTLGPKEPWSGIDYPYILKQFDMIVSVQPPLNLLEQLELGTISPQVAAGLYGLVITPVIAWLVPRILESVNARRQRINLRRYMKEVNKLNDASSDNKEKFLNSLATQMRKIEDGYTSGKISESQYGILKDKISEYREDADR